MLCFRWLASLTSRRPLVVGCGPRKKGMESKINVCVVFFLFFFLVVVYADDIVWSSVFFSFIFLMERAEST
jgi:hypothetical protein